MSVAVVVPTQSLRRMRERFHERVHRAVPDATVIYALNGPNGAELAAHTPPDGVRLVACEGVFNHAVVAGLRYALSTGADAVVRMDAEEHPPEVLPDVLARLGDHQAWVIDLSFEPGLTINPGTADSYHNLHVIPTIVTTHAADDLVITGAHGFMVFTAQVVAQVLPFVADAVDAVEDHDPPVVWGADTLLAVCAAKLGFNVSVTHVPAEVMRDRPEEKCLAQLRDTLAMVAALERLRLDGVVTAIASRVPARTDLSGGAV